MTNYRNPLAVEPSNPHDNVSEMAGYTIAPARGSYAELAADAYDALGVAYPDWLARELGISSASLRYINP